MLDDSQDVFCEIWSCSFALQTGSDWIHDRSYCGEFWCDHSWQEMLTRWPDIGSAGETTTQNWYFQDGGCIFNPFSKIIEMTTSKNNAPCLTRFCVGCFFFHVDHPASSGGRAAVDWRCRSSEVAIRAWKGRNKKPGADEKHGGMWGKCGKGFKVHFFFSGVFVSETCLDRFFWLGNVCFVDVARFEKVLFTASFFVCALILLDLSLCFRAYHVFGNVCAVVNLLPSSTFQALLHSIILVA